MGDEKFSHNLWKNCGKTSIFEAKFLNSLENMTICTIFSHFIYVIDNEQFINVLKIKRLRSLGNFGRPEALIEPLNYNCSVRSLKRLLLVNCL